MPDWTTPPDYIVTPAFAGPDTVPRTEIGPVPVPANLATYLATKNVSFTSAIITYDAGGFSYYVWDYAASLQLSEQRFGYMTTLGVSPTYEAVYSYDPTVPQALLSFQAAAARFFSDVQIFGNSIGRGTVGYAQATTDTGGIGTGGAVGLSFTSDTLKNGRGFKFTVGGSYATSLSTNHFQLHMDRGGVTFWGQPATNPQVGALPVQFVWEFVAINNSGADIVTPTIAAFVIADAGTVNWRGFSQDPRFVLIEDIGPASRYSGAPQI